MLFSDDQIQLFLKNPIEGVVTISESTTSYLEQSIKDFDFPLPMIDTAVLTENIVEAISIMTALKDENEELLRDITLPKLPNKQVTKGICVELKTFFSEIHEKYKNIRRDIEIEQRISVVRNRINGITKKQFTYEFTDADFNRIQVLLNELRDQITQNTTLEEDHKRRLLLRLERLQSELHKRVSELDHFWGLIGNAGVIIGKLGKDAKPMVDRIREIADIVMNTQTTAEQLPSSNKPLSIEFDDDKL